LFQAMRSDCLMPIQFRLAMHCDYRLANTQPGVELTHEVMHFYKNEN